MEKQGDVTIFFLPHVEAIDVNDSHLLCNGAFTRLSGS